MADNLLLIHSYIRWIVLVSFLLSTLFLVSSILKGEFSGAFKKFHKISSISISIQFLVGIFVYATSPLILGSLENMGESMKNKESRYFLVEHGFTMFLALGLLHFLSARLKKDHPFSKTSKVFIFSYSILIFLFVYGIPHGSRPLFR